MPSGTRHFVSLSAQVAAALREEIDKGVWGEWLPGERALTDMFQVSRKTLRKALVLLRSEGQVEAVPTFGNRIVAGKAKGRGSGPAEPVVILLTPTPLDHMRPYTSLWVSHLKSLLIENGVRLRTMDGKKFFSRHPGRALQKLASQQATACWLLANSTEATQRWFMEQGKPCVIAGSCHPGIDLPHADLDHYALCRHAAGVLLGAGHRQVALLNERAGRAGDIESEAGFIAGVRDSPHADACALVVHHEHSPSSLGKALQRLLEMPKPPTALLVSNGASYLTVISVLAQRHLRVPHDISIISRDAEPFLDFLVPLPARYAASSNGFAKKLLKPLLQSLVGETIMPRSTRILPAYTKGASLSTPQARRSD